MTDTSRSNLPLLPEIWDQICSHLSKPSLLRLRLTSSKLYAIASPCAFRALRLDAYGSSAERFVNIAKSTKLRDFVRELTIDTWIGPEFRYNGNWTYNIPVPFMHALPYLRCFSKVTGLHLRFSEFCGDDDRELFTSCIEETWPFRYTVLDTIFHCITGIWTKGKQIEIDNQADLDEYEPEHLDDDLGIPPDQVIQIKELTISNLADYDDPFVYSSEAWRKLLCLPSLVDLKLLLACETDEGAPETAVFFPEKYEMFKDLPYTWFSSGLGENLRVLSLCYRDYWGWFPMMDFRDMGGDSPFPHLKVLALGNYVFSHEWQIDWFASVGKNNGSNGLEELYLDDCPILFQARQLGPLSSNYPGYPDADTVMARNWNPERYEYTMRWHHVLSKWATSMKGLKVFKMGHGEWSNTSATLAAVQRDEAYTYLDGDVLNQRISDNVHRNFACPELVGEDNGKEVFPRDKYLHGTGISQCRSSQLQYIKYDIGMGPSPYLETNHYSPAERGWAPEEGTLAKDDGAYELLIATTRTRALGSETRG
ncbi:hypothetical protein G7Z17_g2626 [Cylindrodendrum hubeiense]|uniref:F-box domain-containing protein n=1 Tax=Cylindrodendrum hubeiense TaxID=595255 RepID=A0A9P5LK71_9HYPO|nr:hypothetical protein G7Z17_g2626 [Cylindrodendrum hubeiense]